MNTANEGRRVLGEADADKWIDAMVAVLDMPLDDANRGEIRANFLVAHRMAASILDFALDDREEILPVYQP